MIDVEPELQQVQIEYIKRQLKMLKTCYYDSVADYEYNVLCAAFEDMLTPADSLIDELTLYKEYYKKACEYLFRSLSEDTGEAGFISEEAPDAPEEKSPF